MIFEIYVLEFFDIIEKLENFIVYICSLFFKFLLFFVAKLNH